jgi:hypothetical protein
LTNDSSDIAIRAAAVKIHPTVQHAEVDGEASKPSLNELEKITMSPRLPGVIGLDGVPSCEFWYYTGEESVHYRLLDTRMDVPYDSLPRWVERFESVARGLIRNAAKKT